MEEILKRALQNLLGRVGGPMSFRLLIQPTVAVFLAVRAGLKDAREGRPAFLWAVLSSGRHRPGLLQHGWQDVGKVFIIAMILDAIYQLIVHRGVYAGEMLITATVLAIIPYILVRGPVNRIARRRPSGKSVTGNLGNGD